jgi:hypothetical protein
MIEINIKQAKGGFIIETQGNFDKEPDPNQKHYIIMGGDPPLATLRVVTSVKDLRRFLEDTLDG